MWAARWHFWAGDYNLEWLRDWIMQIAGIIVLGAICDMIITEGEMKKYVKMVMGLVLIFAIIRPVTDISHDFVEFELPQKTQMQAAELKNRLGEKEQESLLRIYRQKLAKSVKNEIYTKWQADTKVDVTVEENDESRFGNIKTLTIEFAADCDIPKEEIKEYIGERFDVNPRNIKVK